MTYRLLMSHLRSRRTGWALLTLTAIAVVNHLVTPWTNGTSPTEWLLLTLPAVAAAAVIATSTHSPFGEPEQATNPLPRLRFSHLLSMIPFAGAAFALTQTDPVEAVRNLAGLTGLALLTAAAIGTAACWITPLAYAILCGGAIDLHETSAWTWPALPSTDSNAMSIALALLLTGAVARTVQPK
jgi:hypothetical protein